MHINVPILIYRHCTCNYIPSVVPEIHCLLWDIFHVSSFAVVQLIGGDPENEPVIICLNGAPTNVIEAILLKYKLDLVCVDPAIRVIHGVAEACPRLLTVHVGAWIGVEIPCNCDLGVTNSIRKDALPDLLLHLAVNAPVLVP